jgi:hypothetical protein
MVWVLFLGIVSSGAGSWPAFGPKLPGVTIFGIERTTGLALRGLAWHWEDRLVEDCAGKARDQTCDLWAGLA